MCYITLRTMKALHSTTVIHVSNLKASIDYYTNVFCFDVDFIFGDYVGLYINQVSIHLSGPNNPGRKKAPGEAHLCIDCDEVEEYYEHISANGAIIDVPLDDREYGMRDFAANDPDGNTLVFGKAIS